jgi:hypothetical protein
MSLMRGPSHTTAQNARVGGAAGLAAAVLFVITTILSEAAPIGTGFTTTTAYVHQGVLCLAYVAVLVTLQRLHPVQKLSQRYGRLGTLGTALAMVGYGVVLVIVATGIIMGARVLNDARILAAALLLVGSAVLGVVTVRARVLPWWCGALLISALPLGDVANQAFDGGEGLVLALLWGSIGTALLKQFGSVPHVVSASSERTQHKA